MNKKAEGIRIVIYLVLVVTAVSMVRMKQMAIEAAREKKVISSINEWEEQGKPVSVLTVRRHNFNEFTKVTAERAANEHLFISYLPQEVVKKIKVGQAVYCSANTEKRCGTVTSIDAERNLDTGLFKVELDAGERSAELNHREILFIHTHTLEQVLHVPHDAVDLVEKTPTLRLVVDGRVVLKTVAVGAIDREAIVIQEGLREGDRVIIEGKSLVHDGERVMIVKEVTQ